MHSQDPLTTGLVRVAAVARRLVVTLSTPLLITLFVPTAAMAQKPPPAAASEGAGPAWSTLTPAQKATLAPLQRDWSGLGSQSKQKWLELAEKYQTMPPADRQRVQERMTEWSRLSPEERSRARLQYQQARQMPAQDRQQHWETYQALPTDEKQELANRSKAERDAGPTPRGQKPSAASASASLSVPKAAAPAMVQAKPGASTLLISKTPATAPPAPAQKIVAPPGQVDRSTLLPKSVRQDAPANSAPPASAARPRP
jgi:Protein of unknown function (DUF3106)